MRIVSGSVVVGHGLLLFMMCLDVDIAPQFLWEFGCENRVWKVGFAVAIFLIAAAFSKSSPGF